MEETGIPALELHPERVIEHPGSGLKHQVRTALRPAHLLTFREALSDNRIDGGLREGRRDPLAIAMSLGVVRDGVGVAPDVGAKFVGALAECLDSRVGGREVLQVVEVVGETVNAGQRLAVIAVPQVPFDAFQFPPDSGRLRLSAK